jgi:hypothetical protein
MARKLLETESSQEIDRDQNPNDPDPNRNQLTVPSKHQALNANETSVSFHVDYAGPNTHPPKNN